MNQNDYPAIQIVIALYKGFAFILALILIVLTLFSFSTGPSIGLITAISSFIIFIITYASSEILELALSINSNVQDIQRQILKLQQANTMSAPQQKPTTPARSIPRKTVPKRKPIAKVDQNKNADDMRPAIGLNSDGLPNVDWVDIPAGQFLYGENKQEQDISYDFKIAKYPVTYAQFQTFVDAPDGLHSSAHNWFEGLHDDANQSELGEQRWKFANRPRENVNWYQAMAFCHWLSYTLGGGHALDDVNSWAVRLPTEKEWEKAARGTYGYEYPYGNQFVSSNSNTREMGIRQTTVVDIFPEGASPYGVWGMSGNVWEWCLSDYQNPMDDPNDEELDTSHTRALRGGAFLTLQGESRTVSRTNYSPNYANSSGGFRVIMPSR